jgi:hypothetical protein
MKNFGIFLLFALAFACKNQPPAEQAQDVGKVFEQGVYGDTIETDGALTVAATLESLKTQDSMMCAVSGYVTSVCQAKGCWMMLSENPADTTGIFVKFRDYGFFVPKDLSGSKVVVRGKAFKEITSVDELRHYAEDEGKSKEEIEAITQPMEEMKFMADGVVVMEGKK